MFFKKIICILFVALFSATLFAQKDSTNVKIKNKLNTSQGIYNPLSPSKAAFYSAIFPGMGQIYNRKYWKAPIVWGALAIPTYYYQLNNSEYKRYRRAYKLRKNGLQDEFTLDDGSTPVSLETIETAQKQLRENRDMSLLTGVILYVLQIVEASVNAHLIQFNTDDNLSFKPALIMDPINIETPTVGLTIKYNF
ncbi:MULTISPECIES: DUF5683 domain-containing protein [unclassified Polaribacter]|uniref:DUF5683 domain-containing protein n=1 Tax=unclassified Polaribacter TaxID=196858 RepID=UPI00055F1E77|nr:MULTISPECIES: DUF5683 domain-containing protein [unclassified Polaribacter]MBT3741831.1 hypothetical protein [Polaribacter sp.]MBT7816161.1 hypothetical protein [Polaribacter sp.]MDG1195831.1 DUF5683 domain-containing protein [Polaribacter sp.]MDG1402367.1 DUF5683 domain-containing protein [Polaribacter sp.]